MSDVIRIVYRSHSELVTEDFYSDRARGLRINYQRYSEQRYGVLSYFQSPDFLVGSGQRYAGCQWEMLV